MKDKICCIFNLGPHYRAPIYKLMDRELGCDFFFGDHLADSIKSMDHNSLIGFKGILPIVQVYMGFEWQKGVWRLIFKPYKHYIITGTPGSLSNWFLVLLAPVMGKRVYAWTHGMKGNKRGFGKWLDKTFYRFCYKVLLYGHYSEKIMLNIGFKANKLIPIYNSLDYKTQLDIRKSLNKSPVYSDFFENTHPVIVYIGRLQKSKRIDLLVKALAQLKSNNIPCNLVLIGKEVEDTTISKLVSDLDLVDHTWFYGPCYDEKEIGKLLFNADLMVSPGPVGLSAIHAMTYGVPIITNDDFSTQMPEFEIIDKGETGDYFVKNDFTDLVEKISKWINLNPKRRQQVRNAAYARIDNTYNPINQLNILKSVIFKKK